MDEKVAREIGFETPRARVHRVGAQTGVEHLDIAGFQFTRQKFFTIGFAANNVPG